MKFAIVADAAAELEKTDLLIWNDGAGGDAPRC